MKITVTRLKEIIKEEVSSFVSQEQPIEEMLGNKFFLKNTKEETYYTGEGWSQNQDEAMLFDDVHAAHEAQMNFGKDTPGLMRVLRVFKKTATPGKALNHPYSFPYARRRAQERERRGALYSNDSETLEEAGAIDMQALKQKLTVLAQAPTRGLGRLQQADLQTFMQAIDTAVTVLSKV
jgi:hypothetical protein